MENEEEEGSHQHQQHRICDYCETSVALVYCKADSAKLCLACDNKVHVTNQLFSKHFRSLLCDTCHDSPSSVFCDTESSVLCQNCDWQHHTSSSSLHSRRPLEGFSGCPSVTELLALVGLHDLTDKALFLPDSGGSDQTPPQILSLNDLVVSDGSSHNYRAMDVPPLPKNRHATCGRYKEEMMRQLRELSRSEPSCLKYETLDDELGGFLFLEPGNDLFSSTFESQVKWFEDQQEEDYSPYLDDDNNHNNVILRDSYTQQQQDSSSSVMVPVSTSTTTTRSTTHEINSLERNSALSRYKAKKKSRRYEKHIRYESRKVRAESRTRIRGRFAKSHP
ncbi:unnamed protein product [Eruca vesicaria subsp. sativa]|uniref:Uncharacterized protein n=1 Tax=Eruca vesicaria subsp. sativa TaxID=29727 RepID=A0ABC8JBR2_ERUVS|nr:unnamed protein product [Eruca vesicaria subsp. sativa]